MRRILFDLDPRGYEDCPLDRGNTWDTRVHDIDVLWETLLFRHLIQWTDYRSDFQKGKQLQVKADREPSQEV